MISELVALLATLPLAAAAADAGKGSAEGSWSATLTSTSPRNNTITARNWLLTRTFRVGEGCAVSCVEKPTADLNDLRPGEEITIHYHRDKHALVADRVAERALRCNGTVATIDPKEGFVTLSESSALGPVIPRKGFRLAGDCTVTLSDRTKGSFNDVKPGDRITIIYGYPDGFAMAYRIGEETPHLVSVLNPAGLGAGDVLSEPR